MAIGFPQSIKNSQTDSQTSSAFPIINAIDIDFRKTLGEKTVTGISYNDTFVLQMSDPISSANVYHTPVSAVASFI